MFADLTQIHCKPLHSDIDVTEKKYLKTLKTWAFPNTTSLAITRVNNEVLPWTTTTDWIETATVTHFVEPFVINTEVSFSHSNILTINWG